MVARNGEAGIATSSLLEVLVVLIVVGTLALTMSTNSGGELRFVGDSFAATKADRLAAGCLEQLRAAPDKIEVGRTTFRLDAEATYGLPDARGERIVARRGPGLFDVTVRVSWTPAGAQRRSVAELSTVVEGAR